MTEKPQTFEATSLNISDEQKAKLKYVFPEVFTEGGKVDFERLKLTLGDSVDAGKERYGLTWPGKSDCFKTIQRPSMATLVPAREESENFDDTENLIIEGDNLEVLKLLQKSYLGKVKMIYIDPPYNTGSDFIYPDDFTESLDTYLRYTGQVDSEGKKFSTNSETDGRFHSKWLNMMYPRLFLARNLLRDDGVIFVSIDDSESANLKRLLDEIFGEENFIDTIAVEMSTTSGPKTVNAQQGTIVKNVEFVYVYRKSEEFDKVPHTPLLDGIDSYDTHYSVWLNDDKTLGSLGQKLMDDSKVGSDIRKYGLMDRDSFSINNINKLLLVSEPAKAFIEANLKKIARVDRPPVSASGRSPKAGTWETFEADHRTYFLTTLENGTLQALMPLSLNYRMSDDYKPRFGRTVIRGDLWKGFHQDMGNVAKEGDITFSNGKKPVRLIKQLIKWANSSGDGIVLDFFAGSATSAHAVLQLNAEVKSNLRFIMVQLPESLDPSKNEQKAAADFCDKIGKPRNVAEITKERVRRVLKHQQDETAGKAGVVKDEKELKKGFKVFKLQSSNFKAWNADIPKDDAELAKQLTLHVDHLVAGRTQEEVLYELLLKSGFPLSTKVAMVELAGKHIFSIADGAMLICLEKELTPEVIKAMADKKPERVVCLDAGFANNDQLKTNAVQTMKARGVTKFQTV
jgi:adenine-specific DNA-methyltransferase